MKKKNNAETVPETTSFSIKDAKTLFSDKRVIAGIILFVFVTVMFAVSVNMRSKYDYISLDHHHHLTATSVAFTNNWLDDGIFHDHFAMMANPESVEFPTLKDRSFYDSYPPGCVIPLYALAKISGTEEISFGFVRGWDLFNQYAITMLLAFLVYMLFLKLGAKFYIGLLAAVVPTAVNLFMPAPFYFFHSVYFSDQAVILPFVLTLFLEFLHTNIKNERTRRVLGVIEAVVIFAGTFTDYLYLCVLFIAYIKRLVLGEITVKSFAGWLKGSLTFVAPALLAAALFAIQLAVNGPVRIVTMFKFRTGMEDTSGWTEYFPIVFWKEHILKGYGAYADIIIKASLAIVIAMIAVCAWFKFTGKRENKSLTQILAIAALAIIPCFMQVYLLKNHSAIHDFSSLKFSVVMSLVPYVLIPAGIVEVIKLLGAEKKGNPSYMRALGAVTAVFALISCVTVYFAHTKNAEEFFPNPSEEVVTVGRFMQEHTGYNDVVFSDNYEISDSNDYPARVALAKKRIYRIDSVAQIYDKVRNIEEDYTVNLFSFGSGTHNADVQTLVDLAEDTVTEGDITLYKISKDVFERLISLN